MNAARQLGRSPFMAIAYCIIVFLIGRALVTVNPVPFQRDRERPGTEQALEAIHRHHHHQIVALAPPLDRRKGAMAPISRFLSRVSRSTSASAAASSRPRLTPWPAERVDRTRGVTDQGQARAGIALRMSQAQWKSSGGPTSSTLPRR